MMKRPIFLYSLLLILVFAGCKKQAEIQPDEAKPFYTLPQGNHPYDDTIVDFYRTYGCYILYKFSEADFRWNINNNLINYEAEQGDENYIAASLAALDQYVLKFYTADFLKKALPYKIILSAKITKTVNDTTIVNSTSSSSHFAFGRAGSSLDGMTDAALKTLKVDLNREFWTQAITYDKIALPPFFVSATNYENVQSFNKKNFGVLMAVGEAGQTLRGDFLEYISLIAITTKEELEKTLFLPANDPNGKYKLKYNTIIDYYKTVYGIDLQAMAKG